MEVLLYLGLPTKNEHDDFSCPQKFIAYPQPHEILKCRKYLHVQVEDILVCMDEMPSLFLCLGI